MLLVPKTVLGLQLVPEMMLESMTVTEVERAPEGSLSPQSVSEMGMSHQEWVLK